MGFMENEVEFLKKYLIQRREWCIVGETVESMILRKMGRDIFLVKFGEGMR